MYFSKKDYYIVGFGRKYKIYHKKLGLVMCGETKFNIDYLYLKFLLKYYLYYERYLYGEI